MKVLRWLRDRIYDPVLMTRFHAGSLLLWSVLTPVTVLTPLKDSVPWISFMSAWALSTGAWAALQAAHGEKMQDVKLDEVHACIEALRRDLATAAEELRNTTGRIPTTEASSTGGETWQTKSPSTRASTPDSSLRKIFRSAFVWATILIRMGLASIRRRTSRQRRSRS